MEASSRSVGRKSTWHVDGQRELAEIRGIRPGRWKSPPRTWPPWAKLRTRSCARRRRPACECSNQPLTRYRKSIRGQKSWFIFDDRVLCLGAGIACDVPAEQRFGLARRHQTSRDVNDWEHTAGDFLTAWHDHGESPRDARYE